MQSLGRLEYQRIIVGYHGCDRDVALGVLQHEQHLRPSENEYDWLGKGIYFWEHAPRRALDFATEQIERDKVEDPTVIGAYINLGRCFDLTDVEHTRQLSKAFDEWSVIFDETGVEMPANRPAGPTDSDILLRFRDCALLNWYMKELDKGAEPNYSYQTIRGVFQEGPEAFDGSGIREKTHIQVAVRDPSCIIGYFLPTTYFRGGENE
jgi:hypothetical protein